MESEEKMDEIPKVVDLESQLRDLRERDKEIASIGQILSMTTQISRLENETHNLRNALTQQTESNAALMKTLSWRVTKPLRLVRAGIGRFFR